MKFISLCAGKGTRLEKYVKDAPKCMLKVNRYPIIYYQLKHARQLGLKPIVVKGYKSEKILHDPSYTNEMYETTNMLYSLMLTKEEFDEDIIVSYGDIIYNKEILEELVKHKGDIVVTGDINWKKYWNLRYGNTTFDTETFVIDGNKIINIGQPPNEELMDARFVGLIKFTVKGLNELKKAYDKMNDKTLFMTDVLQYLIKNNVVLTPHKIKNGWLEFDTNEDYERVKDWIHNGVLEKLNICCL